MMSIARLLDNPAAMDAECPPSKRAKLSSPVPSSTATSPFGTSIAIPCSFSASSSSITTNASPNSDSNGSKVHHRAAGRTAMSTLKFGIENILQAEFGTSKSSSIIPSNCCALFADCAVPSSAEQNGANNNDSLPSWIFCTRYSDRPSSGHRTRKAKRRELSEEEKRPRTAFTAEQLERLKAQFVHSRYLTEKKRQELAHELGLNECQIKIWFQNKRAKLKKSTQRSIQQQQTTPTTTTTALHNLIDPALFKRF